MECSPDTVQVVIVCLIAAAAYVVGFERGKKKGYTIAQEDK